MSVDYDGNGDRVEESAAFAVSMCKPKKLKKLKSRTKKVVNKKVEENAAFAVSMCKQKWLMFLNAGAYVSGICISIV